MSATGLRLITPQTALGVCIAFLGLVFTLDNLGFVESGRILRFWPLLPVGIGLLVLLQAMRLRDWVIGTLWLAGGTLLLMRNLGVMTFELKDFLPLVLVALGLKLVAFRARAGRAGCFRGRTHRAATTRVDEPVVVPPIPGTPVADFAPVPSPDEDTYGQGEVSAASRAGRRDGAFVQVFIMMGGVSRRVAHEPFRGAELTAIMGGCELDLRHATIEGGQAVVNAFTMWGGIEIRVPPTWNVINEATAFMGGAEDSTRQGVEPGRPRLVLRGFALMGGIEVKN
jgi:Cell wall-active antibiotics response 4TMS YvqF